jgi:hypothetical protein
MKKYIIKNIKITIVIINKVFDNNCKFPEIEEGALSITINLIIPEISTKELRVSIVKNTFIPCLELSKDFVTNNKIKDKLVTAKITAIVHAI